jgi:enoyl-CoA hydratase
MRYSKYEHLLVVVEDGIATVTLNRPEHRNAANPALHAELENIWLDIADDEAVRVVVLTGAGKAFSAGGDVKGMAARAGTPEGLAHSLRAPGHTRRIWQNLMEVTQPIVAAINGDAAGFGATLALFCDITVMSETARIGDSHVKVGLVAGDGGAVIFPLLIGLSRAKDMLMRGKLVTGIEARDMQLVNYAFPAEQVLPEAMIIARELAELPTWAVRWTKLSVNKQLKDQFNLVLDTSIAYEMLTMQTGDFAEATKAFVEKRKPAFKHG